MELQDFDEAYLESISNYQPEIFYFSDSVFDDPTEEDVSLTETDDYKTLMD